MVPPVALHHEDHRSGLASREIGRTGMRFASKMFAASTLVILALVGVPAWSLLAVDHLVRPHREITYQSLPALQAAVPLQHALPRMLGLAPRTLRRLNLVYAGR